VDAIKSMHECEVSLEEQLTTALAAYVAHAEEMHLGRAYELGRAALAQGWSIPHVVATYSRAMLGVLGEGGGGDMTRKTLELGAAFLAESLSSYEMTHRGYREAIIGLRHLNDTLEQQVKRIAHALHDEAGQLLVSVYLALADLERDCPPAAQPGFRRVQGQLEQIEYQLRHLSHELRPTVLDDLGWLPAIEFLADGVSKRARLPIRVRSSVSERLPAAIETALYRTIQEALTNASRHARATRVEIEVDREADALCCLISDDGIGFEVGSSAGGGGLGLKGMRERLSAVNGTLQITSTPSQGTRIRLLLPMGER
jgi:two-component system, NarL family, sensor histidine kinase UhpB